MHLQDDRERLRARLRQIFTFLKALDEHRNPAVRQISGQPWSFCLDRLPHHSSIRFEYPIELVAEEADAAGLAPSEGLSGSLILRAVRPKLTSPPPLPDDSAEWVDGDWRDPFGEIHVRSQPTATGEQGSAELSLGSDTEQPQGLQEWLRQWTQWSELEQPARHAMAVFEELYALHATLKREDDEMELLLGDGVLRWRLPDGGLHHPLLVQRAELHFDPKVPEFLVTEADTPVELYTAALRTVENLDGAAMAQLRDELEGSNCHPQHGAATNAYLRGLVTRLSAQGEFVPEPPPSVEKNYPVLGRQPWLFLRRRSLGFARAIEQVLKDLEKLEELPAALLPLVGWEPPVENSNPPLEEEPTSLPEPAEILLCRPANREQVRAAQLLEHQNSVVLQGPPGTGKTHTISNLIGHLLAQGKSVLVTSHTAKALSVLRDQVVPELRALCLSTFGHDQDSREQLKRSVEEIVERLSTVNPEQYDLDARLLRRRREQLIQDIAQLRERLVASRSGEYRQIVILGQSWEPSEAARTVARDRTEHSWIPGPVRPGDAPPLAERELEELYGSNGQLTPQDEELLTQQPPRPGSVPPPESVRELAEQKDGLAGAETEYRGELWTKPPVEEDREELTAVSMALATAADELARAEPWKQQLMEVALSGDDHARPWNKLMQQIRALAATQGAFEETRYELMPVLPAQPPRREQIPVLEEIKDHLRVGKKLSGFAYWRHPEWKELVEASTIAGRKPNSLGDFEVICRLARLDQQRDDLLERWNRQAASIGLPDVASLGDRPERKLVELATTVERGLKWRSEVWEPLRSRLLELGFAWKRFEADSEPALTSTPKLDRLRKHLARELPRTVTARRWAAEAVFLARIHRELGQAVELLKLPGQSELGRRLVDAIERLDSDDYAVVHHELRRLEALRSLFEHRQLLLGKMESFARAWGRAIADREGVHSSSRIPGEVVRAWVWRQLNDELERRDESLDDLQTVIEKKVSELRRVTADLVSRKAWAAQVRRTTVQQRLALFGWRNIVDRTPRTSGVPGKLARLRREAQRAMQRCHGAVPVWIMPLNRLVDSFDFGGPRFDVAIIDEASQTDIMGLLVFYLAKKVLVVGDHEQVSPSAVGQKQLQVRQLIDEHLYGIPNAILYDGETSIYDLARQSSGSNLCLLEHFRSVPEIIQFSNDLSYDGRIRPLRESASARLQPALVPYRVVATDVVGKVNDEEATVVASLIVACAERPEYRNLSIGAVSMVGTEQAIAIEQLLRQHLQPDLYERHRLICGNAAQFQGDERDVMFLSVVDVAHGGPLPMRQQKMFQQRFNVAASRARDQMWVVHSLDASRDLAPGDLRRRLIEHAQDPQALVRKLDRVERQTESEFEARVARRLITAGYRVIPQYRVGYYRIDLVVTGDGKRLAIECDGDRYHPLEAIRDDMERQATLERLGWRFVRIRGSVFFRDPESAMRPVFEALQRSEIPPEGKEEAGAESESPAGQPLIVQEIIERAAQLRRLWRGEGESEAPGEAKPGADDSGPANGASAEAGDSKGDRERRHSGTSNKQDNRQEEEAGSGARGDEPSRWGTPRQSTASVAGAAIGVSRRSPMAQVELELPTSGAGLRGLSEASSNEAPSSDEHEKDRKGGTRTPDANADDTYDHSGELREQDGRVWLAMSHWAKIHSRFQGWERGILFTVGRNLRTSRPLSVKQVAHAKRLYSVALEFGFDREHALQEKPAVAADDVGPSSRGWPSIDDVPQAEIQKAVLNNVPTSGEIQRETLLGLAREQLGFDRLGRKIRQRLNRSIGAFVRAQRLGTDWNRVWRIDQHGTVMEAIEPPDGPRS